MKRAEHRMFHIKWFGCINLAAWTCHTHTSNRPWSYTTTKLTQKINRPTRTNLSHVAANLLTGCGSSFGKDPMGQLSCSRVRRQTEANCLFCHQMRYWVLGLVPSPGKVLPGEVDRCLTGPRGITHVSGEPLDYQKKKIKNLFW